MPTWTLDQLDQLVLDRVEGNNILYSVPERYSVINQAIRIINLFSAFNETSIELPGFTVANQLLYSIPSPIIFPTRIAFEGRDLDKTGLKLAAQTYRSWAVDTTDTYGPVARWIPIGIKTFALHPIDAQGGNDLTITGVAEPNQLVNPDDVMQLDDEFVSLIADYGGHRLCLKEAGKTFADASVLIQAFWREMKTLKRWDTFKAPRYFVQVQQPQ